MSGNIVLKNNQSSRFCAAEALTCLSHRENDNHDLTSEDSNNKVGVASEEAVVDLRIYEDSTKPKKFPQKLIEILSDSENESAISWLPDGRAFSICDRKQLSIVVLPKYFKRSKYASFTRRLNRWGFTSFTRGAGTCIYYHKMFQRDNSRLSSQMFCNDSVKYKTIGAKDATRDHTSRFQVNNAADVKLHEQSEVRIQNTMPLTASEKFYDPKHILDTKRLVAQQIQKELLIIRRNTILSQFLQPTAQSQLNDSGLRSHFNPFTSTSNFASLGRVAPNVTDQSMDLRKINISELQKEMFARKYTTSFF